MESIENRQRNQQETENQQRNQQETENQQRNQQEIPLIPSCFYKKPTKSSVF